MNIHFVRKNIVRVIGKGIYIMFKLNEKVVYPGHGVAIVEERVVKSVEGNKFEFFKLSFLYKDVTVLVPVNNVLHMAIRYLSNEDEVKRAINELHKPPERKLKNLDFTPSGWNKRNKDFQLKIQKGLLIDLAKIYRDLMFVAKQKELSFGEKSLLQTSEELLSQEIEIVMQKDRDLVLREIRGPFREYMTFSVDRVKQTTSSV